MVSRNYLFCGISSHSFPNMPSTFAQLFSFPGNWPGGNEYMILRSFLSFFLFFFCFPYSCWILPRSGEGSSRSEGSWPRDSSYCQGVFLTQLFSGSCDSPLQLCGANKTPILPNPCSSPSWKSVILPHLCTCSLDLPDPQLTFDIYLLVRSSHTQ